MARKGAGPLPQSFIALSSRLRSRWVDLGAVERWAGEVLSLSGGRDWALSILLVGDGTMRRLNRDYLGHDRTTDVLSFPLGPDLLGDVVISVPTAARQARRAGISLSARILSLLIHGVLHLRGWDHERSEKEARRMAVREEEIFLRVRRKARV